MKTFEEWFNQSWECEYDGAITWHFNQKQAWEACQEAHREELLECANKYWKKCEEVAALKKDLEFIGCILEGDTYEVIGRALEEWYEEIRKHHSLDAAGRENGVC